jgi:Ala-tRNA(Pro) deacylase
MTKRITKTLDKLGIKYRVLEHEAVFTVKQSKQHLAEKVPVKSLLLKEKKGSGLVLVVMHGDKRLNTNLVNESLGLGKLEFAKPEVLKAKLGVTPGSVSLFSLLHSGSEGVKVVIDKELIKNAEIGFHPNENTSTVFINGQDILIFIKFTGHSYQLFQL